MSRHPANSSAERFRLEAWPLLSDVLRAARFLTGDEHLAEDLAQETMLRAYRNFEGLHEGSNMRAWLMKIMRNLNVDRIRHENRQVHTTPLGPMESESTGAEPLRENPEDWQHPDDLLNRFDDETIEAALRQLPESMRWVLLLVDVQQMSVVETAEILTVAEGTVKSRASRARAALRSRLLPMARRHGWVAR